ncbi:MAG: exodeoxyribonuclease VII large subunit, partial [Calditerrivibrio sp.]|nr:exodeoxyribonuclease VII large subunit [Calditerrivibrio sp.]
MKQFTVTEITRVLKNLIESNFDGIVSVEGEISNLSISPSGHLYFVLKDENAQIKVALFKKFILLNRGYTPKNGDSVIVYGELTVYEADGNYQIIARKIEYREIGIFYKKFEETKKKLEAEGLFDKIIKKKIPDIIEKVAVITSPNGAAFKDFMKILRDNKVPLEVHLWGVQVQGAQAVNEIVTALDNVSRYGNYDLVILMRGGGSLEDLAIFNDEFIARGVSNQKNPTITAIGHERDTTIVDFVADM